jgi:ribosomal protein L37AE/L43A
MKKYNSKQLTEKGEIVKRKGNVLFGCDTCGHQWNQDDYSKENYERFYEGLQCPNCEGKNVIAL